MTSLNTLSHTLPHESATGYYDAQYNPTGAYPVIPYCESGQQTASASPYEDQWMPPQAGE